MPAQQAFTFTRFWFGQHGTLPGKELAAAAYKKREAIRRSNTTKVTDAHFLTYPRRECHYPCLFSCRCAGNDTNILQWTMNTTAEIIRRGRTAGAGATTHEMELSVESLCPRYYRSIQDRTARHNHRMTISYSPTSVDRAVFGAQQ